MGYEACSAFVPEKRFGDNASRGIAGREEQDRRQGLIHFLFTFPGKQRESQGLL
jgi:hypothetical protein